MRLRVSALSESEEAFEPIHSRPSELATVHRRFNPVGYLDGDLAAASFSERRFLDTAYPPISIEVAVRHPTPARDERARSIRQPRGMTA
jgi:hypothetical protein